MMQITAKTNYSELEEGEFIVDATDVCVHCLEPIYFGTGRRQPKKYDQYHNGNIGKFWLHQNTMVGFCSDAPRATPFNRRPPEKP